MKEINKMQTLKVWDDCGTKLPKKIRILPAYVPQFPNSDMLSTGLCFGAEEHSVRS